ncbi:hypothetical protein [Bacteroides acidifaciens]|nr:hypothetical protein [Bacteroides acidifaciens]
MTKKDAIKVFEAKKIRAVWDEQKENGIASWRWTEKNESLGEDVE